MAEPIHFYFDFISPFGYFAALRIEALATRHGRATEWHAMLLGVSVLKAMGLRPVAETPLKGPYLARDAARYARRHGVGLSRPLAAPPMNPLAAARAVHWLKAHHPDRYKAVARALYEAYWRDARDISAPEAIAAIAAGHGLDPGAIAAAIGGEEARRLLRSAVAASLELGVFGSPFFIVDGEPFWGADKLELLDDWLAIGGW
jgi:2-hydroxychromene-2-carboxylate isomerase